jgi:hypothetical protein
VVEVGVAAWIAGRWITPLRNRLAAGLPNAGAAPVLAVVLASGACR